MSNNVSLSLSAAVALAAAQQPLAVTQKQQESVLDFVGRRLEQLLSDAGVSAEAGVCLCVFVGGRLRSALAFAALPSPCCLARECTLTSSAAVEPPANNNSCCQILLPPRVLTLCACVRAAMLLHRVVVMCVQCVLCWLSVVTTQPWPQQQPHSYRRLWMQVHPALWPPS